MVTSRGPELLLSMVLFCGIHFGCALDPPLGIDVIVQPDSDTSVTVFWMPPDQDCSQCTYKILYKVNGTADTQTEESATNYRQLTSLKAGTTYEVQVVTVNGSEESVPSTAVTGSTKPSAPTGVTATAVADTIDSITVSWDAQAGVTYKVEYSVAGDDSFQVARDDIAVGETSYVITGLTAGTQYDLRVTAKKNGLDSESTTVSAVASIYPAAPTNVQASTQSTTRIRVTWGSPSDADTFKVEYSFAAQQTYTIAASNIGGSLREYEITGLGAGLKYDIRVSATKYSLESAYSAVKTQATKPAAPTGVTASAVDANTIEVTWTSDVADSFRVVYLETGADASSGQTVTDNDGSPATVSGLKAQTGYTVRVIAVKHGIESDNSSTATATTKAEASGITVTSVTTTSISISMTENTGTNVVYTIYYTDTTAQDGEQEETSTTHTYTIPNLKPGHIYDIAVVISVNGVPGDHSETKTDSTKPKQPTITELKAASTTQLSVTWGPAADSTQASYKVQYKKLPSGSLQTVSGCSSLTCIIDVSSAGDPGQEYEVSVSAVQLTRESDPAKENANTKPNPPGALSVDSRAVDQLVIKSTKPPNTVFSSFKVDVAPQGGPVTYKTPDNELEATIPGLTAGTQYNVAFRMVSGSEESTTVSRQFYTKPATPGVPTREAAPTDSLTVSWAASDPANLDSYKLTLKETSSGAVIGSPVTVPHDPDRETTFNSLTAGREYTVTVVAVVGTVESDAAEASMTIKPSQAKDITAKSAATSSLTVQWDAPSDSDYTSFVVSLPAIADSEVTVDSSDPREATWSDLTAGIAYLVSVSTRSGDQASVSVTKSLYTLPEAATALAVTTATTTSIDVQWTAPASNFDGYIITLKKQGSADVTAKPGKQETGHQLKELEPGSTYTVSLVATVGSPADQVESAEESVTIGTNPNPPTLNCGAPSETSITITVKKPASGGVEKYLSTCSSCDLSETRQKVDRNGGFFTYSNLERLTHYIVEVQAVFDEKVSESVQVTCRTGEAPPGPVATFEYDKRTLMPDEITLKWTEPVVANGVIERYELSYVGQKQHKANVTGSQVLPTPALEYTFTELKAGFVYTFVVKARTAFDKPGEAKTLKVTMPYGEPFCKENCAAVQAIVAETEIQSSSVMVKFRNPFSDRYGEVDRFSVIVSTSTLQAPRVLSTWAAAKTQANGDRTFAAIWQCPDFFIKGDRCWNTSTRRKRAVGDEITVTIGGEVCDSGMDEQFCNGPLDSDIIYFFTLRGHTEGDDGLYKDTAISSPVRTGKSENNGNNNTALIVGLVLVVVVIASVALVAYLLYRNRRLKQHTGNPRKSSVTNKAVPDTQNQTPYDYEDVELAQRQPNNMYERPVPYENLGNQYAELKHR